MSHFARSSRVRRNVKRNVDHLTFRCSSEGIKTTEKEAWSLELGDRESPLLQYFPAVSFAAVDRTGRDKLRARTDEEVWFARCSTDALSADAKAAVSTIAASRNRSNRRSKQPIR
jgi:hypothetical protein